MWKLGIEDDQGNKTVVNLVRDEYSVGRSEENTVRLTERNISRKHAALRRNGTGWILEDMASYNGCFVNGVRVSEPQRLEHGDLVQLGDYRLEILDEAIVQGSLKSTSPTVPKSHSLVSQPDRLVMLAGPTPGAEYALSAERVVIGRGEECDISINHASVSRVHAEIHALGDGRYEIVDRESANGIRVNGVDLKRSLIDARDTIELGDVVFKFIPAGQIYALGADQTQQMIGYGMPLERHTPAPGVGVERRAATGIPPVFKVFGALMVVGILLMVGMVAFSGHNRVDPETAQPAPDVAAQILGDALALVQKGDVEGAHKKLGELPEDSNARQSDQFRQIEAQWADALFEKAKSEPDPAKKRAYYDQVAKATTVDSTRRKQADTLIAQLDQGQGMDINQLPSAPKPETSSEPVKPTLKNGIVRKDPFGEPTPKKPSNASTAKPKASATAPNVENDLLSGDRQKLTSAKNYLKGKVASGKASDSEQRQLRALCRQLGDMSCAN